jgi:hypothetical protein
VVALPEELPVHEASELVAEVREMGVPLAYLVMNAIPTPLFTGPELATLAEPPFTLSREGRQWVNIALEHGLAEIQANALHERVMSSLGTPVLRLPWVPAPESRAGMATLTAALLAEIANG